MTKIKFLQDEIPEEVFFFEAGLKWAESYLKFEFEQYMTQRYYTYPHLSAGPTIKDYIEAERTIDKYRKILDTDLYKAIHDS